MPYAIHILETGGPEVMRVVDVPEELPGPGQISIDQTAVGLNFIDVYHRTGLYPIDLPAAIGLEAAGSIDKVGDGVTEFSVGDRVAYAGGGLGAYTSKRVINADAVVKHVETFILHFDLSKNFSMALLGSMQFQVDDLPQSLNDN